MAAYVNGWLTIVITPRMPLPDWMEGQLRIPGSNDFRVPGRVPGWRALSMIIIEPREGFEGGAYTQTFPGLWSTDVPADYVAGVSPTPPDQRPADWPPGLPWLPGRGVPAWDADATNTLDAAEVARYPVGRCLPDAPVPANSCLTPKTPNPDKPAHGPAAPKAGSDPALERNCQAGVSASPEPGPPPEVHGLRGEFDSYVGQASKHLARVGEVAHRAAVKLARRPLVFAIGLSIAWLVAAIGGYPQAAVAALPIVLATFVGAWIIPLVQRRAPTRPRPGWLPAPGRPPIGNIPGPFPAFPSRNPAGGPGQNLPIQLVSAGVAWVGPLKPAAAPRWSVRSWFERDCLASLTYFPHPTTPDADVGWTISRLERRRQYIPLTKWLWRLTRVSALALSIAATRDTPQAWAVTVWTLEGLFELYWALKWLLDWLGPKELAAVPMDVLIIPPQVPRNAVPTPESLEMAAIMDRRLEQVQPRLLEAYVVPYGPRSQLAEPVKLTLVWDLVLCALRGAGAAWSQAAFIADTQLRDKLTSVIQAGQVSYLYAQSEGGEFIGDQVAHAALAASIIMRATSSRDFGGAQSMLGH